MFSIHFQTPYILSFESDIVDNFKLIDMNSDNQRDLVYFSSVSNKIEYKLNINSELSDYKVIVSDVLTSNVFDALDFDDDGDIDIISYDGKNVSLFENMGNSNFQRNDIAVYNSGISDVNHSNTELYIEDMDNDGHMDILLQYNNQTVYLHKNPQDNTFSSEIILSNIASFIGSPLKINNDLYTDIPYISHSGSIMWLSNNSYLSNNPNFVPASFNVPENYNSTNRGFIISDFNNDNYNDMAILNGLNNNIVILRQNYLDVYYFYTTINCDQYDIKAFSIDFDNDGYKDIILSSNKNSFYLCKNELSGFSFVDTLTSVFHNPDFVFFDDWDNNGYIDIIYKDKGQVFVLENESGSFSKQKVLYPAIVDTISNFYVNDVNNDGLDDIIYQNSNSAQILLNDNDTYTDDLRYDLSNETNVKILYTDEQFVLYSAENDLSSHSDFKIVLKSITDEVLFEDHYFLNSHPLVKNGKTLVDIGNDSDMDFVFISTDGLDGLLYIENFGDSTYCPYTRYLADDIESRTTENSDYFFENLNNDDLDELVYVYERSFEVMSFILNRQYFPDYSFNLNIPYTAHVIQSSVQDLNSDQQIDIITAIEYLSGRKKLLVSFSGNYDSAIEMTDFFDQNSVVHGIYNLNNDEYCDALVSINDSLYLLEAGINFEQWTFIGDYSAYGSFSSATFHEGHFNDDEFPDIAFIIPGCSTIFILIQDPLTDTFDKLEYYEDLNSGNYPNPFNPETNISFSLKKDSSVELTIFNIKGEKVKKLVSDYLNKGNHSYKWNGTDNYGNSVSSGVYFYKISTESKSEVKKMLLLK